MIDNMTLQYESTYIGTFMGYICSCLDIFLSPVLFYQSWNYCIANHYHLPNITYVHALLLKFVLELFFYNSFTKFYIISHNRKEMFYYYDLIFQHIKNIETNITNKRTNNLEMYRLHTPYNEQC